MTDKQDFFSLNNIDLDKAYEVNIGARGGGKLFFLEQLCIKQREEINRLQAENERLLQKLQQAQEDTVKEFIDRFDKKIFPLGTFHDLNYPINAKAVKFACDKIAEEMRGKDK